MKNLLIITFFICAVISAQEKNKMITDQKTGKLMLIGACDRSAFADTSFSWWFNSGYDTYNADSLSLIELHDRLNGVEITIVMGSWCSDSRREVPRFFKILDKLNYDQKGLSLYCVDRDKKEPSGIVEKFSIKLVPTFIILRNKIELGRITESPEESLEKDLLKITGKQ